MADKMSRRTLLIVLFSCIAVMVTFTGLAVAAFTVSGDGLAAGAVAEVKPLTVTEGKIASGERVIPGGTGFVSVKIKNPNVFNVEVTLTQDGPITTDVTACDAAWFTFTAPTESIVIASGKSLTVDLPDALALSIDAGTECSSAAVRIPVAVAGVQIVDGTTTTTTTTPPQACQADVMFVVDRSGSIGDSDPEVLSDLGEAVNALVAGWDMGPDATRTGLTIFGESGSVSVPLTGDPLAVGSAIGALSSAGLGCTSCGLETATTELLNQARPGVPQSVVLWTDGETNSVDGDTLEAIASHINNFFNAFGSPTYVMGTWGPDLGNLTVMAASVPPYVPFVPTETGATAQLEALQEGFNALPLQCGS